MDNDEKLKEIGEGVVYSAIGTGSGVLGIWLIVLLCSLFCKPKRTEINPEIKDQGATTAHVELVGLLFQ